MKSKKERGTRPTKRHWTIILFNALIEVCYSFSDDKLNNLNKSEVILSKNNDSHTWSISELERAALIHQGVI